MVKLIGFSIFGLLAACSSPASPQPTNQGPATNAEIESHLKDRLRDLAIAYPEAELSAFAFSTDRRTVCGLVTSPGETPMVFISSDTTPDTVEDRPLGIPNLTRVGNWYHERNQSAQARVRRQCAAQGVAVRP
ncbi:hypothetical protein [Brevundimonas sp. DWR2-3-1b1]|uniref:hypothetical protein n=1 Tax=unclassified Brevundimonas TaxID=2622653 RepID=UPI003CF5C0A8